MFFILIVGYIHVCLCSGETRNNNNERRQGAAHDDKSRDHLMVDDAGDACGNRDGYRDTDDDQQPQRCVFAFVCVSRHLPHRLRLVVSRSDPVRRVCRATRLFL